MNNETKAAIPVRIRLSRANGFDLQTMSVATNGLPAINVARPTKWGNPFVIGKPAGESGEVVTDAADAVRRFRAMLEYEFAEINVFLIEAVAGLEGRNLACWCRAGEPCHADVLLEFANGMVCEEAWPTAVTSLSSRVSDRLDNQLRNESDDDPNL